ncbi:MAG: HdeD family acid-resistance protein [Segniliparus sp.]|uniref:HdeD family acid-resistance protein n=1 Tax=Segniliparus sp. TaxID=2804064 RepID=UPI003F32525F
MSTAITDNQDAAPVGQAIRSAWRFALGLGLFSVLLGAALLIWPAHALVVAGAAFGVYLLFSGAVEVLLGFASHQTAWTRVVVVIAGILSIMMGVLCFRDQLESVLLLSIWIGTGWIMTGVGRVVSALAVSLPGRGLTILTGVLLTIAGVSMVVSPIGSIAALSLVAGVWLVVLGLLQIIEVAQLRRRLV